MNALTTFEKLYTEHFPTSQVPYSAAEAIEIDLWYDDLMHASTQLIVSLSRWIVDVTQEAST